MLKYRVKEDYLDLDKDDIVYPYLGYHYGIITDDEVFTGENHIAVTKSNRGQTPFTSVPVRLLEPIDE